MRNYSQWGQAPILKELLDKIGSKHNFALEFGAADGFWLSNIRGLMELGWTGLQFDPYPGRTPSTPDANHSDPSKANGVHKEFITAENINDVFRKYGTPHDFDLLIVDIDGNEYWVWKALELQPSIIMIEYNPNFNYNECKALKYNPNRVFEANWAHSASMSAFEKLAKEKGYYLYHEIDHSDLIFVRNDHLAKAPPLNPAYLDSVRARPAYSFWGSSGDPVVIRGMFEDV
jgi:hypothetical protein